MKHSRLTAILASLFAALCIGGTRAGQFQSDFSDPNQTGFTLTSNNATRPDGSTFQPVIESGHLVLARAEEGEIGTVIFDDLDPGSAIESFNLTYDVRIGGGSSTPADGMSIFLGQIDPSANFGEEGPDNPVGLTISFDIYDNGGGEAPAIDVKVNGTVIAHHPMGIFDIISDTFTPVSIQLNKNGTLNVSYKGQAIFSNLFLPGYAPQAGDRFAIGARTGGLTANEWVDNLNIATVKATATAPTITTQPTAVTVAERGTATFSVAANGSAPFTFQWFKDGQPIQDATGSTYTIASTPTSAAGNYKVVVTNGSGSAPSDEVALTVTPDTTKPTVTSVRGSETFDSVVITFSEPVAAASGTDKNNYTLSGGLTVNSVSQPAPNMIVLQTSKQAIGTPYTVTVKNVQDTAATANTIADATVNFSSFVASQGFLKYEYWANIAGNNVADLTADDRYIANTPDMVGYLTAFTSRTIFPDDSHEAYGARVTGFVSPPVDGDYRFFLSSDDASELWLSTDESAANLVKIAEETGCCNGFTEPGTARTSDPIHLEKGKLYYVQALHKEGVGGDYVLVAWREETDTTPAGSLQPIPGTFLSTFVDPGAASINFTKQPLSVTAAENTTTTFIAEATGSPAPLSFQWQRQDPGASSFQDIAGATGTTYRTPVLKQTTDNGAKYRVVARVPGASATSSEAALTVIIDSTPPQLLSAQAGPNQKTVTLTFSEELEGASAGQTGSYSIQGLTITGLTRTGPNTVVLNTSAQTPGTTYTVVAAGVRDSAGNLTDPNANSKSFTAMVIQPGVILYEMWSGIPGTAVSALTSSPKYSGPPDFRILLGLFDGMSAFGEYYGAKISGFVTPTTTGDYRFFISSDDSSALYVSTDDSPAHLPSTPTAEEPGCCRGFAEPADGLPITSAPLHLEAGKSYYIVYFIKEHGGGDYGRVAWREETDTTAVGDLQPIPGKNLAAALPPEVLNGFILKGGTAAGSGTADKRGFKIRVNQVDESGGNAPANEVARAEQQLAGILGPNVADPATRETTLDVINFNQEMNTGGNGTEVGDFTSISDPSRPDAPIPGVPGSGNAAHNLDAIAAEILTYVDFPQAGVYYMGVNSDDGFAVTNSELPPVNNGAVVIHGGSAAGSYHAVLPGRDGIAFPRIKGGSISGKVVYATPAAGCDPLTNGDQIKGNIALIDRGVCSFSTKVGNALKAGAIAVIIVNSRDPDSADGKYPIAMGGDPVDLPAVMITKPDGAIIKAGLADGPIASITEDSTPALGEFDAGRGASDTIFPVIVPQAGVYPLRAVWFEGGGGANMEWFSVTADGQKVLLNDPDNASALKAFTARSGGGTKPVISISKNGADVVITFTGTLQSADKAEGPYTKVTATSPLHVTANASAKFWRAVQ